MVGLTESEDVAVGCGWKKLHLTRKRPRLLSEIELQAVDKTIHSEEILGKGQEINKQLLHICGSFLLSCPNR